MFRQMEIPAAGFEKSSLSSEVSVVEETGLIHNAWRHQVITWTNVDTKNALTWQCDIFGWPVSYSTNSSADLMLILTNELICRNLRNDSEIKNIK